MPTYYFTQILASMINFDAQLKNEDYEELISDLLENLNDDGLIEAYEKVHLSFNKNYYPLLLGTLERFRESVGKDAAKLNALDELKEKFEQLNNVFPFGDLPNSIVNNYNLRQFLEDERGRAYKQEGWEEWNRHIQKIIDSTPRTQHIPFFEWCIGQLRLNWKRHKIKCENPPNGCRIEMGYESRVQYFERKIEDFKLNFPEFMPAAKSKSLNKIQWLGNQKELAELFVELQRKGWIEKFENETIQDCFTESNSVPQYLKPGTDTKTGEHTFENLYTGYSPQFYGIKENPKRHK